MSTQAIAPTANEHTTYWDAVARPPASALKQIRGGRLAGMTDVNPQWRYRAMTETFGPCGEGWKYEITRTWTEPGTEGQVLAFAEVALYWRPEGHTAWSGPIPGIGGSMLVAKESSGLRTNDEGYKMAVTDALSVAMKMLGVAADIYAGLWDGSKYKDAAPEIKMPTRLSERKPLEPQYIKELPVLDVTPKPAVEPELVDQLMASIDAVNAQAESEPINPHQLKRLFAIAKEGGHAEDAVKAWLKTQGFASRKDITVAAYDGICARLADKTPLEV